MVLKSIQLTSYPSETRIDAIVAEALKIPRQTVRGLFDHDKVRIDGRLCAEGGTKRGNSHTTSCDFNPSNRLPPIGMGWSRRPFNVVFEDRDLLVVTKHAGILTSPSPKGEKNTLQHWIDQYYELTKQPSAHAMIVHRLDRDTSGVLVTAKNPATGEALIAQFKERKPGRVYMALLAGNLNPNGLDSGTYRSHFIQDKFLNIQSSRREEHGLEAITHFKITGRHKSMTQVEVRLETGRRNQIRVHFSEAGHPVLGDERYKSQLAAHPDWPPGRLALHAASLTLVHPRTGKTMTFEDPPPLCFEEAILLQNSAQ